MTQAMDIQAMQSMDWLFKKERIYLLAQFWQQRATLAEKEVAALKEQLASPDKSSSGSSGGSMPAAARAQQSGDGAEVASPAGQGESGARPGLEQELVNKEKEISQLSDDIARLQTALSRAQEGTAAQVARLQEQLEQRSASIARLEARLEAQRDYEDVKRELSILRSMDLPTFAAAAAAAAAGEGQPPGKALEILNEAAAALTSSRRPPSPISEEANQAEGTRTPTSSSSTTGPALFPPALQTVETFGSFLGEEIVANWRRSLERTILSQNAASASLPPPASQVAAVAAAAAAAGGEATGDNDNTSRPSSPEHDVKPDIQRCSPPDTPTTPSMQQMLQHQQALQQQQILMMNGNTPKTPPSESNGSGLNSPNNGPLMHTSTPISSADAPKTSPFRFDERGPFRFDERVNLGESLIPKGDPMEARLQEMLRYNMDQYASQNLDTLHIARRVRELLSIHNIGQRLFAKYVLGLSQGTVSELLSKPKPWDKLTEKGRDSYRKMHAWACDENAVMLLKSLIPKKGKEGGGLASFGGRPGENDSLTEERIAHILSEASQAMKGAGASPQGGPQGPPNPNVLAAAMAAAAAAAAQQHQQDDSRSNDSRSPASAQEKMARIYQEELAKLMGRRLEDSLRVAGGGQPPPPGQHFPSLLFPHFFGPGGPAAGPMDRTHDEIRLALDAYHRELSKLNHSGLGVPPGLLAMHQPPMMHNGQAQDLSLPKERPPSARDPKSSPLHSSSSSHNGGMSDAEDKLSVSKEINAATEAAVADALRHAGSAFSLVRPKTEPGSQASSVSSPSPLNSILPPAGPGGEDFTVSAASPLQRMASITNSLISSPSTPSHHSPAQRPLKAVLPPITQQQFDQFNNLNTEDIVKKVKEQLSQYSISQRLFGESVLGLSQGSVSDLLARPKPWHMLTQKGREPFIRMKMFLEDENAVHKLVASQYKIAPEKLMRTGGYGSINPPGFEPMNFGLPRDGRDFNNFHPKASMNKPPSKAPVPKLPDPVVKAMENAAAAAAALNPAAVSVASFPPPPPSAPSTPSLPPPQPTPPAPSPGPRHSPPAPSESPSPLLKKTGGVSRSMVAAAAAAMQNQQPSVYEMAALTQDLDTQLITTRIKEALLANNIGQKTPHAWPKGVPPEIAEHDAVTTMEKIFGEVVLGLSQGSVSELLSKPKPWHMLSIKGREPFIRMQLWLTDPHNVERLQQMKSERREANKRRRTTTGAGPADNSSDTSSNDTNEFYHATSGSPGPPSNKKQRVLFSEEQKEALRLAFALDPYPNMATIEFLANELNLAARTITNWFHNHRMRLKQTVPHGNNNNEPVQSPQSQNSNSNFDPAQFRLLLGQRLVEIHKERGGGAMPPFPFFNPSVAMVSPATSLPNLPPLPPLPPQHLLAAAMREQMSGLDLSMTSIKKEASDSESGGDSDDSNMSTDFSSQRLPPAPAPIRSASRRKPAAPQWVNPEWQEDKEKDDAKSPPAIINGVCVMQTDNFDSVLRRKTEPDDETVRLEPTPPEKSEKAEEKKDSSSENAETTLELGVNASTEQNSESVAEEEEESDDWEQKIQTNEESDKQMKVGGDEPNEDWEF